MQLGVANYATWVADYATLGSKLCNLRSVHSPAVINLQVFLIYFSDLIHRSRKKTIGIVEYVYDLKKVQMKVRVVLLVLLINGTT